MSRRPYVLYLNRKTQTVISKSVLPTLAQKFFPSVRPPAMGLRPSIFECVLSQSLLACQLMACSSKGTYMLSNLLQELALARDHNRKRIVLDEARLTENPVDRLSRMIKNSFWHSLTRRIDGDGLEIICADPKNRSGRIQPRIYVPHGEPAMVDYYRRIASEKPHLNLDVQVLPPNPGDPYFVKSLNSKPGILALAMNEVDDGRGGRTLKGIPFIVPGARFNEVRKTRALCRFIIASH